MTSSNEDVQRLLASLASYNTQSPNNNSQVADQLSASSLPGLGGLPLVGPHTSKPSTPAPSPYEPSRTPQPSTATLDPRLKRPISRTQSPRPPTNTTTIPDASTITDWPSAIRHVMTHLAPDPAFAAKIRRLISAQHNHERDWWDKRASIVSRHAARDTSSAQLSSIFASLGVPVPSASAAAAPQRDLEAERRELAAYDAKVYKQLLALAGDFDRQLRGLGVPFYAIKHELVVLEEGRRKVGAGAGAGRIDKGELRELQRRMLGWLEISFPVD